MMPDQIPEPNPRNDAGGADDAPETVPETPTGKASGAASASESASGTDAGATGPTASAAAVSAVGADEGAGEDASAENDGSAGENAAGAPDSEAGTDDPSAALLRAVEEGRAQAERDALRAMAEQSGLPMDTLAAMLEKARAGKAGESAAAERALRVANERLTQRLLTAEVRGVGAEMGLVDAEVAMRLIDPGAIRVTDDGAVEGVRAALETLRQSKRYLFQTAGRPAMAQRMGGGAPPLSGVEEAFYRKNPALRR